MKSNKPLIQILWGIALILAGLGMFFRIPHVMPQIKAFTQFAASKGFILFCFYLIGVLLIGGGIKKIKDNYKQLRN